MRCLIFPALCSHARWSAPDDPADPEWGLRFRPASSHADGVWAGLLADLRLHAWPQGVAANLPPARSLPKLTGRVLLLSITFILISETFYFRINF